jgi:hypothetical protein
VIGNYFAIHVGLPDGPGNQLSILTAEIENKNLFRHGGAKVRKYGLKVKAESEYG